MDLSLIVPSYNEARNIPDFLAAATRCLDAEGIDYELVFVDDGSGDDTGEVLRRCIAEYRTGTLAAVAEEVPAPSAALPPRAHVVVVELSRNFGKEAAMYAGLERATGDCIGFIDADLQQDPQVALRMFRMLRDRPDLDCIAAAPKARRESLPLRVCKRFFYRAFNGMSDTRVVADVSDFRVFRRPVAEALLRMHEQFRFSKGLFAWVGFRTEVIPYEVHDRHAGKSKWTVRQLMSYAWNGVLAFSTWPLKVVMYLGVALALIATVMFIVDLFDQVGGPDNFLSFGRVLMYVVLLMGGLQMIVLGVIGEYMARAYIESKNRPIYLARSEYASRPGDAGAGAEGEGVAVAGADAVPGAGAPAGAPAEGPAGSGSPAAPGAGAADAR